ncbi:hypothetical protein ACH5RR_025387 [Cinchona calisaya]|uniref:Non-specific lipid-transfer protein n=1 Tax=Cinchona calisaya TaxID=153742 RepID=A0ABD2Z2V0_9GENT
MANSTRVVFKQLVALVFLGSMLVNSTLGEARDSQCGTVVEKLRPCMPYIEHGGRVPPKCCYGIKSLVSSASTKKDRQDVCNCLNKIGEPLSDRQIQNAARLPGHCHATISFTIKRNINCKRCRFDVDLTDGDGTTASVFVDLAENLLATVLLKLWNTLTSVAENTYEEAEEDESHADETKINKKAKLF